MSVLRRLLQPTAAVAFIVLVAQAATADWLDIDWRDRRPVIFDNSASATDLADFPALVHLDGSSFDFSRAQSQGQDLRFTAADGTTLLSHEIEKWDATGQEAWVWVKVPQLDAGSTGNTIWMYSANGAASDGQNAADVWSNGYVLVHHMNESPGAAATVCDSTSNGKNGVVSSDTVTSAAAVAGDGFQFSASSTAPYDYYRVPGTGSDTELDLLSLTLETWVNPTSNSSGDWIAHGGSQFSTEGGSVVRWGAVQGDWGNGSGVAYSTSTLQVGQWSYLVGTAEYDAGAGATSIGMYFDGMLEKTGGRSGTLYTTGNYYIGNSKDFPNTRGFPGLMDELRLSDVARSDDWIYAQYFSMSGDMTSFGALEQVPEPGGSVLAGLGLLGVVGFGRRRRK